MGFQKGDKARLCSGVKYRKLFDALADPVFIADYDTGVILDCNAASFELTSFSKTELIGVKLASLFCGTAEGSVGGSVERFLGCEEGQVANAMLITKGGEKKAVAVRFDTLMFKRRKIVQLMLKDVTEKRNLEELLVKVVYKLSGLSPGDSVIYGSHERCFNVYESLVCIKLPSLCIVHGDPQKFIAKYDVPVGSVRLLASKSIKGFSVLPNLQELSLELSRFLNVYKRGVVLLDGLEHLISTYGFETVYQFIQEKHFDLLEHDSFLLMPMNLDALSKVERAYLASEVKIIEGN
ncbi:MAG: DUF835 domain-containing protein [Candidatus Bathyarchaeota archaeon]|nr:DUF835 domain-containing protein [Candidatus Bathyarchaeota archaeon]